MSDELKLLSNNNVEEICADNSNSIQNPDEWLAIKTENKYKLNDLVNIVSLSVELEKITIVTREHNRLVTDSNETKQWYGIFTVEQLYLIHQQICQIDPDLDKCYPIQLKPIKGYLSTYFNNDLKKSICTSKNDCQTIDLQDNFLCNSIRDYLKKCIESIGVSLFVDILFNDLSSNDYFEIYSEFNLKRMQNEIDRLKEIFLSYNKIDAKKPKINDIHNENFIWEFKRNLKNILDVYFQEDKLLNNILLLYAEYYNNLLKPMIDSRELAEKNLKKFEKKLENQIRTNKYLTAQSSIDALKDLEKIVQKSESEIFDLSNDIDNLCIEFKQNVFDMYVIIDENMKKDKLKFFLPKNNPFYLLFGFVIQTRVKKVENELSDKKIQILSIQLKITERKLDFYIDNEDALNVKDLKMKKLKQKLQIYNEKENLLKKSLNDFKEDSELSLPIEVTDLANQIGKEYFDELKEKFNIDSSKLIVEKSEEKEKEEEEKIIISETSESDDDDYLGDDTKFFDAYESPEKIKEEENKQQIEKNNKLNALKKKILNIGSKKSSLRLALKKLEEQDALPQVEQNTQDPLIKTMAMKKEEDRIQKQLYMENRNKALQRLKEYKMKKLKDPVFGSNDSLASVKTNFTEASVKSIAKKPYIPKSKQRILPPNFNKPKIIKKEIEPETQLIIPSNQPTQNLLNLSTNQSIAPVAPPPPPPPPPLLSIFTEAQNVPQILLSSPPPPPPPPPPIMSVLTLEQPVKKLEKKDEPKEKLKEKIEFDINEIKTFKFKKSNKSRAIKEKPPVNQFNSWESLMNEIRTNAGRNLRNITNDKSSKKSKCDFDLPQKSKLEWDLNLILSQRSKFFNLDDDDDDDDASSDTSWNAYIES